jgi:hypothetical protein
MADGSNIAFFDLGDETAAIPSPNTPAAVIHFAKELDKEEVTAARERLLSTGVDVSGVTDHVLFTASTSSTRTACASS